MRHTVKAAVLSFALIASVGAVRTARGAEGADPRTPAATEAALTPSRAFARLWELPGSFTEAQLATVIGKTLYLSGLPRGLEAVDVETGRPRWVHLGELPLDYPPTEKDGVLYIIEGGHPVTLDAATGEEKTRTRSRVGFLSPLYPVGNYSVFGSGDGYAYTMNTGTGIWFWRRAMDSYPLASATDGRNMVYFLTSHGTLFGVYMDPPELAWNYHFLRRPCSAPAVGGGVAYVGSVDDYLYAIDAMSGSLLWRTTLSAPVLSLPVLAGGRVYAATTEKLIHAVDTQTHKDLWTVPGERVLTATATHVILLRRAGPANSIALADAATGKVLSEATADRYVLFAADPEAGVVYSVGKGGDVLAIGDRDMVAAREAQQRAAKEAAATSALAPAPAPAAPAPSATTEPTPPATPGAAEPAPAAPEEKP